MVACKNDHENATRRIIRELMGLSVDTRKFEGRCSGSNRQDGVRLLCHGGQGDDCDRTHTAEIMPSTFHDMCLCSRFIWKLKSGCAPHSFRQLLSYSPLPPGTAFGILLWTATSSASLLLLYRASSGSSIGPGNEDSLVHPALQTTAGSRYSHGLNALHKMSALPKRDPGVIEAGPSRSFCQMNLGPYTSSHAGRHVTLLVPQRGHRVDSHRSPRRDVARQHSHRS